MATPPFQEEAKVHRWFGVEFNNLAWDLVDDRSRTPDDMRRMIDAAHAARLHWSYIGNAVNEQRGEHLLATVYTLAEEVEPATRHAERCMELSESNGDAQSTFDRACALACVAEVMGLAGNVTARNDMMGEARAVAATFELDEEREVFENLYGPATDTDD